MRDDRVRLADVLDAIDRVERYASRGRAAFDADELVRTWMVHHLQIIGEACRALSPELRDRHPEVPWRAIVGMRNILVHSYFDIDAEAVWNAVERDVPALKATIERILRSSGNTE
jgi:uncharacterized protein with HEPN domain